MREDLRFTVAIITDTHMRALEGDQSSPYKVNDRANGRARYAVEIILAHQRAFTIHLGDVVHPLPELPAFGPACEQAHGIFAPLRDEMHYVPGNHDIGDKPGLASPAGSVTEENVDAFEANFGPSWKSFEYGDAVFIIINSSLVNSGVEAEANQKNWLEKTLRDAKGKRIFLFSHYPPYIDAPDEDEHYDNYAEPGRSWLLDLCVKNGVEAIFSGHVHQFFFNRYHGIKLYCLPATSFTRQDFSELYRGPPADEFGRDDTGKFGVTLLDVFSEGHRLRFAPTEGREIAEGVKPQIEEIQTPATPLVPHLRHPWYARTTLPYSGPMEEFSRKHARNDYPLLRLWQLGIGTVRTPLRDLLEPESRHRLIDFAETGIKFSFFSLGIPKGSECEFFLGKFKDLTASLEVVSSRRDISDIAGKFAQFVRPWDFPVTISKSTTSADEPRQGSTFAHNVSTGFLWQDRDEAIAAASKIEVPGGRLGLSFQINMDEDPSERICDLAARLKRCDMRLVAALRFADRNPAKANFDDEKIARQLSAALTAAESFDNVEVQCDTFEDIDRGYCPRNGLLDRRSNLRPVADWILRRSN